MDIGYSVFLFAAMLVVRSLVFGFKVALAARRRYIEKGCSRGLKVSPRLFRTFPLWARGRSDVIRHWAQSCTVVAVIFLLSPAYCARNRPRTQVRNSPQDGICSARCWSWSCQGIVRQDGLFRVNLRPASLAGCGDSFLLNA